MHPKADDRFFQPSGPLKKNVQVCFFRASALQIVISDMCLQYSYEYSTFVVVALLFLINII